MKIGKNSNTIALSVLWLSALLMAGCSTEWLDIKPKGRFTEGDLPDGSLEGRVFAAYSGLRSEATSGLPYAAVHTIRSDDAHLGSNSGDYAAAGPIYDDFNYPLSHWLVDGLIGRASCRERVCKYV